MSASAGVEPGPASARAAQVPGPSTYHVALAGDLSGLRAVRLEAQLLGAAESTDRLVVNLSRVTHLGLVALRSLVRSRHLIEARRGEFVIQGLSPAAEIAFARAGVRWTLRTQ